MEPEIFTDATFKELCTYTNPSYTPHAVEVLSPHEICLTYKQGEITLGHVAGELMAIESWMDFPILVTIVIIKRSKVNAIVEARQKHQQKKETIELDKLKQGQYDLQDELDQVPTQKEKLA